MRVLISSWVLGLLWLGQVQTAVTGLPKSTQACDATCTQCTSTEAGDSRCCLEGCGYGCDDKSVVWDECIKGGCFDWQRGQSECNLYPFWGLASMPLCGRCFEAGCSTNYTATCVDNTAAPAKK
ncbi:hypothetical protein PG995_014598 [Apiospora arundinis]